MLSIVTITQLHGTHKAPRITNQELNSQLVSAPNDLALYTSIKKCICDLKKSVFSAIDQLETTLDILLDYQEFQNHQGKKERFAGNNGTGQSAQIFFNVKPLLPVTGTRVNDTTFTRTSGTFEDPIITGNAQAGGASTITLSVAASTINNFYTTNIISITAGTGTGQIRTISNYVGGTRVATVSVPWATIPDATSVFEIVAGTFVGQYAFSYATGNLGIGVWVPIIQNTSTSLVVNGVLQATGTSVITSVYNPIANLYPHGKGNNAFSGGVFDGEHIWFSPWSSPDILKFNPATGQMTAIPHRKNVIRAFADAIYDGESVWLVPFSSRDIIKIGPDGTMTSIAHNKGNFAFFGGAFDGTYIWFSPQNSPDILRIDPATNEMLSIPHGKGNFAFIGAVYDGFYIWFIPQGSPDILRLDPKTNDILSIPHNKGAFAFGGGVFDGEYIWLIPFNSTDVLRLNPATLEQSNFAHGTGAFGHLGGAYDGSSIWSAPQFSDFILKIEPRSGAIVLLPHGQGSILSLNGNLPPEDIFLNSSFSFFGPIFDGTSVWLTPHNSDNIVRILPPRYSRGNLNIPNALSVGGTFNRAGALRDASIQYEVPVASQTITISADTDMLLLDPAGALPDLTITFPSSSTIGQGQIIHIASSQSITTLTLNGGTINGALTTISANGFAQYIYEESTTSWFRIG